MKDKSNVLASAMGFAVAIGIVFVTAFAISKGWQKGQETKKA